MNSPGIREQIRAQAVELLRERPEGLRYSELLRSIKDQSPSFNVSTINNSVCNLAVVLPDKVWKPSKGLYRHVDFQDKPVADARSGKPQAAANAREKAFYTSFANWLVNDAEDATQAIPLGGNSFKDKWGTPDVIGKLESRRSDVIRRSTEIVSAEIKADHSQLVVAYGQACAYRLFSHRSYLVIPDAVNADELDRLDSLCEISGIGLVTFRSDKPADPSFKIVVRPRQHSPDLFWTNKYIALIERKLFP